MKKYSFGFKRLYAKAKKKITCVSGYPTHPNLFFFAVGELSVIFGLFRFRLFIVARNFPLPPSNRSSAISVYCYNTRGALLLGGKCRLQQQWPWPSFLWISQQMSTFFSHKMFEYFPSSSICEEHMTDISSCATTRDGNVRVWPVRRKQGE